MRRTLVLAFVSSFASSLLLASCADAGPSARPASPRATPAPAAAPAATATPAAGASPLSGTWETEAGPLLVLTQHGSELEGYWETQEQSQPLTGSVAADGSFTLSGRAVDSSLTVSGKPEKGALALTLTRAVAGTRIRSATRTTARRRAAGGAAH